MTDAELSPAELATWNTVFYPQLWAKWWKVSGDGAFNSHDRAQVVAKSLNWEVARMKKQQTQGR